MHEVGIMQSALDMAEDKARAAGATKILRIRLSALEKWHTIRKNIADYDKK